MKKPNISKSLFAIFVLLMALGISNAVLSQQSVGTRGIVGTGGACTQADLEAQITAGGIVTFNCSPATIDITTDINVTNTVTVDGTNAAGGFITLRVTTTGNDSRVFDLTAGTANLTVQNLTITNATAASPNTTAQGGAIRANADGAVLHVKNVNFEGIHSNGSGGAIYIAAGSDATIEQSSFVGNSTAATNGGGAVSVTATGSSVVITNSTFIGNAVTGAGGTGGALRVGSNATGTVINNTFVNNVATTGGSTLQNAGTTLTVTNNIILGGATACGGTLTDGGGNVVPTGTTCAGITAASTDSAMLGALTTDTNGPTQYYPLGEDSSAVDLVPCGSLTVDQIGTDRPQGTACDAGAIEQPADEPVETETPTETEVPPTETPTETEVASTETPTEEGTPVEETETPTEEGTPAEETPVATEGTPVEETPVATEGTPVEETPTATEEVPVETPTSTNTALPVPGVFSLVSPEDGFVVRDPETLTAITWTESSEADSYQFLLYQLSTNNIRLGVVIDWAGLTGDADADALTCDAGTCTLTIGAAEQGLLVNGQYAWTVLATNVFGSTEAGNAPFFLSVNTNPLELVVNGGFEIDADGDKQPDGWTAKNITKDKVKCNKENKTFSYEGDCAYLFKGVPGEKSKLLQKPAVTGVSQGDDLNLSFYVNTKLAAAGKVANLVVKYVEPTAGTNGDGKDKLVINLSAPTTGETYEQFSGTIMVAGTPAKLKLQLLNKNASGKVFFDAVSLTAAPGSGAGLIPLP